MAKAETDIAHNIMKAVSPSGARLFKNVRGMFYTKDCVMALVSAMQVAMKTLQFGPVFEAVKNLRQLMAGLQAAGSSDLIGFRPVKITEDMIGRTIAVFTAVEVKTATGAAKEEQSMFIEFVLKNGGFAGVARSPKDAKNILKIDA